MVKNNPLYKNTNDLQATREVREELLQSMDRFDFERKDKDKDRVEIISNFPVEQITVVDPMPGYSSLSGR